jgi:cell shape-determining protein MreC
MKNYKIFEWIYSAILLGVIILAIFLFISKNELVAFIISLIGIAVAIFDNIFRSIRKDFEEKIRERKKVKALFNSFKSLVEYLESKNYWGNIDTKDEKINTKLSIFSDNMLDLRKYFGINILNVERGRYDKTITILEGRYIMTFRNHSPYKCDINKKDRVRGPFELRKENDVAQNIKNLMLSEMGSKFQD